MTFSPGRSATVLILTLASFLVAFAHPAEGSVSVEGMRTVDYRATNGTSGDEGGSGPAFQSQGSVRNPAIVGGGETTFEKYPWQVEITVMGQHHCGGTLIHPRIVLTAAHCLVDSNGFFYTGVQAFTGRTFTGSGGEQLTLNNGYIAPGYNPGSFPNDFAFISLASPSSRTQMKIAGADERAVWKTGRVAIATGYGRVVQDGAGSPVLREVDMPIVGDDVCGSPNVYYTTFTPQVMVCAGHMEGGKSTCQGDSGGPLVAPIDGGYRLVGVVSWADGCAKPGFPTVFTRVAEPTISGIIANLVRQIEQGENFPGTDSSVPVVGSGGKPFGCAAALGAAGAAANAVKAAAKKSASAKKAVNAAKKAVKKAKKKGAAAKRKAAKKLKSANRRAKSTGGALARAKAAASAAGSGAQIACG